jgi:hypothetical protein
LIALAASACAIDNHGAVIGRITHADGAVVADLYAIGVHLKTRPGDTGLVLGYSRSSYVFAKNPAERDIAEGWYGLSVPLPGDSPKASHVESVGTSAHRSYSNLGLTLGYRAYTVMAQADASASEAIFLRYEPSRPFATRLQYCKEISQCAGPR